MNDVYRVNRVRDGPDPPFAERSAEAFLGGGFLGRRGGVLRTARASASVGGFCWMRAGW